MIISGHIWQHGNPDVWLRNLICGSISLLPDGRTLAGPGSTLPIISELNQLAGALLGGVAGLLTIWLAGLIIKACSGMVWAQPVLIQIEKAGG